MIPSSNRAAAARSLCRVSAPQAAGAPIFLSASRPGRAFGGRGPLIGVIQNGPSQWGRKMTLQLRRFATASKSGQFRQPV